MSVASLIVAPKGSLCSGTHPMGSQYTVGEERTCLVLAVCLVFEAPVVFCFLTALWSWASLIYCRGNGRCYIPVSYCLVVFPFHLSTWSLFHRIAVL